MQAHPSINLPRSVPVWPQDRTPFASPDDGAFPNLTLYLPSEEHRTGQSVLILPGGGYGGLSSAKEGHRPAQYLNAHGIAAGVLEYRHAPQRHPAPLADAQRGFRILRSRAVEQGLNQDGVGVMGFSAGGHLAGCLATQPLVEKVNLGDDLDAVPPRPDFAILLYPVVSLSAGFSHGGSRENLLGPDPDPALAERLSVEKAVTPETPPMFLFHTQADAGVPVANSLALVEALTAKGVEADLHVFARGVHGIGLADNHSWGRLLLDWLARRATS